MLWTALAFLVAVGGCGWAKPALHPTETPSEKIGEQIRWTASTQLLAGVAKVEITPPIGTPLAGYAKRRGKPSLGIRDPLFVRALAISDGEDTVIFLSADLLVLPAPLAKELTNRIVQKWGLPREAVILAATHTHSGMGGIAPGLLYEQVFGPYRRDLVEGLIDRILWAVRQALEDLGPVGWGHATHPQWLSGWIENRAHPHGATDPSFSVMLLVRPDGTPKGVVVGAAAHPTLLGARDFRISADFPGEVTRALETLYPSAICLFFNGAAGDVRPHPQVGSHPEERLQRFAAVLVEGTVGLINQMALRSSGEVAAWGGWVILPPVRIRLGYILLPTMIGRWMRPSTAFLHLAAIDEMVWIPLPAEMTSALGLELKGRVSSYGVQPWLVGYADGYLGYAVTPEEYRSGSYEAFMTWYGAQWGTILVERLAQWASWYADGWKKRRLGSNEVRSA
jgi:hypothetical protein